MRTAHPSEIFESRYQKLVWLTLVLNIVVILWGAYVRATGSGAGCDGHWPLCNGDVVPISRTAETLIEYTHRLTSGAALVMTLSLVYFSRRFPRRHRVRKSALASGIFIIIEALLGAGLVLFDLVGGNTSALRAVASALHLSNTYLLLASITLTAVWAHSDRIHFLPVSKSRWLFLAIGCAGLILVGASGAITALGDTLFPAENLASGLSADLEASAHFLVRLRVLHPIVAIAVGTYLFFGLRLGWFSGRPVQGEAIIRVLVGLISLQWVAGAVNVVLLAPVWMQLLHLLIADLIWITFVLYSERQLLFATESIRPQ